jgi:hypothetical protein
MMVVLALGHRRLTLRPIVVLVEGANGVHQHTTTQVQHGMQGKVNRGELMLISLPLLQFDREEPDATRDAAADEEGNAN